MSYRLPAVGLFARPLALRKRRVAFGGSVLVEADGPALGAAPLAYGRCWARCDADGFRRWGAQVRSLVSTKARCHAAPAGEAHAAFCTHDDQCGPVHRPRKGNERSPGDPEWWECVDPCG